MKRIITFLLAAVLLIGTLSVFASAGDVAPKFSSKFFPSGKANPPTDVYYEIRKDDAGRVKSVYVWLTQPEDIVNMFAEWNYLGRDQFEETYGCTLERYYIQIDCKVDDGDWHYMPEWDRDDYPQEDQPYDLAIRQRIWASDSQTTYCQGGALIDPYYGQDDVNAGYLKPVIYTQDDGWYLDLDNHSLTLRLRYLILYTNWNMSEEDYEANGGMSETIILSDWSEEIKIGKNATQEELVYPETIEAPAISELTFVESVDRGDENSDTTWKVYVDFPKSNGDAEKYYSIEMNSFEPLCAIMQYRVQTNGEWGEWKDTYWGNPTWLFSGWKTFVTEEVSKDDTLEFRVYIGNNAEEGKDSPYTNSLFCNAGDAHEEPTSPKGTNKPGGKLDGDTVIGTKSKCKVCGICPFQPLGICLFIWLAIILIVIIIVIILVSKGKKKDKKEKKEN